MKINEKAKFFNLLVEMGENYGRAISQIMGESYWNNLQSFEFEDLNRAFNAHCRHPDEGRFFPKIGDIVRWLEGSPESRAFMAWSFVESCTERVGHYQSVVFDDPLIHAVIEGMGGWIKLCEQPLDEMRFIGLAFQKRYRAFLSYPPKRHPSYLIGLLERENNNKGYKVDPPIFLGDQRKAELVFKSGGGKSLEIHTASESIRQLIKSVKEVQQKLEDSDEKR